MREPASAWKGRWAGETRDLHLKRGGEPITAHSRNEDRPAPAASPLRGCFSGTGDARPLRGAPPRDAGNRNPGRESGSGRQDQRSPASDPRCRNPSLRRCLKAGGSKAGGSWVVALTLIFRNCVSPAKWDRKARRSRIEGRTMYGKGERGRLHSAGSATLVGTLWFQTHNTVAKAK